MRKTAPYNHIEYLKPPPHDKFASGAMYYMSLLRVRQQNPANGFALSGLFLALLFIYSYMHKDVYKSEPTLSTRLVSTGSMQS